MSRNTVLEAPSSTGGKMKLPWNSPERNFPKQHCYRNVISGTLLQKGIFEKKTNNSGKNSLYSKRPPLAGKSISAQMTFVSNSMRNKSPDFPAPQTDFWFPVCWKTVDMSKFPRGSNFIKCELLTCELAVVRAWVGSSLWRVCAWPCVCARVNEFVDVMWKWKEWNAFIPMQGQSFVVVSAIIMG